MTTTPAMPELPEPELGYVKTDKSNQPAFSARQMRAALQAQPAAVSDAELRKTIDALRDLGTVSAFYNGYYTLTPDELRRAILALRPQAVVHEDWPLRAKVWRRDSTSEWVLEISGTLCDTYMHCRHTQPLSVQFEDVPGLPTLYEDAQAVPMTDEQFTQLLRKLKRSREVFQAGRDSYETACAPMNSDDEAWLAYLAHHGIPAPAGGEGK